MESNLQNISFRAHNVNINLYVDYSSTIPSPQSQSSISEDNGVVKAYVIITIIMASTGVIGNLLVLGALFIHRKLRVLGNSFIANLAIADIFIATVIDPFVVVGYFTDGEFLYRHYILCEIVASVCIITCSCSIWSICALAINRYVCICHNQVYAQIYTRRTVPLMLFALWMYCLCIDLPNFLNWGKHGFDSKAYFCSYDYEANYSYTLYFIILAICIPIILVTYCYIRIISFVNKSKQKLKTTMMSQNSISGGKVRTTDIRLLKSVATIWLVFTVMWAPYGIFILLSPKHPPLWTYLLTVILAHANSSINSLIYACTNKNFRKAYYAILKRCLTCNMTDTRLEYGTTSNVSGWKKSKAMLNPQGLYGANQMQQSKLDIDIGYVSTDC